MTYTVRVVSGGEEQEFEHIISKPTVYLGSDTISVEFDLHNKHVRVLSRETVIIEETR